MAAKLAKIRREFVDKVSLALIKQLLDDLLDDKVLNDGEKEAVLEENPTKTDKARHLIDIIKKKGDRPSNMLLSHLEERDPTLYSELGLSSEQPAQTGQQPAQTGQQPAQTAVLPLPQEESEGCEMSLTLRSCTDAFMKAQLKNPKVSSQMYTVREKSSRNRLALVITNVEFALPRMKRNGAEKDEENMLKLLRALGYDVEQYRNLSGKEIDSAVQKFSQDPRLSNTDSVFVIIMSHGKLGVILGVDWTETNQAEFPIENIYTHLNTANCPALRDKPKVIIIQACRGEEEGKTIVSDGVGGDACHPPVNLPIDTEGIEDDAFRVHREKDFISLLSCTPHTLSYRSTSDGSFLIQYIVEIFNNCAHEDHIEELFRKVMNRFEEFEQRKQMPTKDRCTLTKHFYLFPGY